MVRSSKKFGVGRNLSVEWSLVARRSGMADRRLRFEDITFDVNDYLTNVFSIDMLEIFERETVGKQKQVASKLWPRPGLTCQVH